MVKSLFFFQTIKPQNEDSNYGACVMLVLNIPTALLYIVARKGNLFLVMD